MGHIWVICSRSPRDAEEVLSLALAEDGEGLAHHVSSSLSWARHDMIASGWKDEFYRAKYPEGFEVIFVGMQDESGYPGLAEALALARGSSADH